MKLLYLLLLSLLGCAVFKPAQTEIRLTVTHVEDLGAHREVYARQGYKVYWAEFPKGGAADSLRRGSVVKANPVPGPDTCSWVFKRIK